MGSFSAEWLTLREPVDARARAMRLTQRVADVLARWSPTSIVDLAAGTGSNMRYLSAYLPEPSEWLLVDYDPALLEVAVERFESRENARVPTRVTTRVTNLSDPRTLPPLVSGRDLVTASALLDLVSEAWLNQLLASVRQEKAAVLFVLNYDGRTSCTPALPQDEWIHDLVNQHQRTDKGFGPALGPDAAHRAVEMLSALGYEVLRERSDWVTDAAAPELQRQLIEGWTRAALEMSPADAGDIDVWRKARLAHVDAGRSLLIVGHEDVAGYAISTPRSRPRAPRAGD